MDPGIVAFLLTGGVAVFVSCLTLFSGFGLGTLLMPAFVLFFPVPTAVAATAVVHLLNNLFKLYLLWPHIEWRVVSRFAVPAALTAFLGAELLLFLSDLPILSEFSLGPVQCRIAPVKLVVAILIAGFALLESAPALEDRLRFNQKHLLLGASLSGFFGGLSGHQGALRSAFLIRFGLTKEAFLATGVACSVFVDLFRISGYGTALFGADFEAFLRTSGGLILFATLAAFLGAYVGSRLIPRTTLKTVRRIVGMMLFLLAAGLGIGLL